MTAVEEKEVELHPLKQHHTTANSSPASHVVAGSIHVNRHSHQNISIDKTARHFIIAAVSFQTLLLVLYAISTDYHDATVRVHPLDDQYGTQPFYFYAMYQDVHGMMLIGFGFIMTFLRRYGFSALSLNLMLCAFGIQWGIYILNMIPYLFGGTPGALFLTAFKLVEGDYATIVVLISFGALLGRISATQLLVLCFVELFFWALNFHICTQLLGVVDVGGSMLIHAFAAYFGLAVSAVCGPPADEEDHKSIYHSDIFAMLGTIYLWLYWPSFNSYFATREYYFMDRAFVNTVLALCGSTASTFIASRWLKKGKFDMVHIQNATLAGGVAVGASADLYIQPVGALAVGIVAGACCVCGFEYISDHLRDKWSLVDVCGVHNLHGLPGVLGGIASAIALAAAHGRGVYVEQSHPDYPFGAHTLQEQAAIQLAGVGVSVGIAVFAGIASGFLIKRVGFPAHPFSDEDHFIVPSGSLEDFLREPIRDKSGSTNDDFHALSGNEVD